MNYLYSYAKCRVTKAGRWNIQPERMKMRMPHIVPLSTQAVQVLQILHEVSGGRALLFPGERNYDRPMSTNTVLKAFEIMGYKYRMAGHGFSRLASTILHRPFELQPGVVMQLPMR